MRLGSRAQRIAGKHDALLFLLLAPLVGCERSDNSPTSPTSSQAVLPPATSVATSSSPTSSQLEIPTGRFDLAVPDASARGWTDAFRAYTTRATTSKSMLDDPKTRWKLEPLVDPEGATVEHVFTVRVGQARSTQVVSGGEYVPPGAGPSACARFLSSLRFPERSMSRHHLGEILRYYAVLEPPLYPMAHTWEAVDRYYTERQLPVPKLIVEGENARFVVEGVMSPSNTSSGGAPARYHVRRTVAISPGSFEVTDERKTSEGWKPAPR